MHEIDHLAIPVLHRATPFAPGRRHGFDHLVGPGNLVGGRRQHFMDDFDLRRMDRHLAFETQGPGPLRGGTQSFDVTDTRERAIDRDEAEGAARIGDPCGGEVPEIVQCRCLAARPSSSVNTT